MPAIQANHEELLDYNAQTANDESRYPQWIQAQVNGNEVYSLDYDLVTGDAILVNNNPFLEGNLRMGVRISGDLKLKDFFRMYYGLRRYTMHIAYLDVPRAAGEPKLLDQTFRELHARHKLMQLDLITRQ